MCCAEDRGDFHQQKKLSHWKMFFGCDSVMWGCVEQTKCLFVCDSCFCAVVMWCHCGGCGGGMCGFVLTRFLWLDEQTGALGVLVHSDDHKKGKSCIQLSSHFICCSLCLSMRAVVCHVGVDGWVDTVCGLVSVVRGKRFIFTVSLVDFKLECVTINLLQGMLCLWNVGGNICWKIHCVKCNKGFWQCHGMCVVFVVFWFVGGVARQVGMFQFTVCLWEEGNQFGGLVASSFLVQQEFDDLVEEALGF